jgi:outer membrane protein OmpA-like peptidoglycan-associated protein
MLICQTPSGGQARVLRLLGALLLTVCYASTLAAQERRYLFELGAAPAYHSYGDSTELKSAPGVLGRVGVWLPYNFSIEADGSITSAKTETTDDKVTVKSGAVSLLYNLPLGSRSWGYGKLGLGGTKYGPGGEGCSGPKICGGTSTFVAGIGYRFAISPLWLMRAEAVIIPSRGTTPLPEEHTVKFSNFGLNLGISAMLGSKPLPDSDHDGVPDNRDRCDDTPEGAQVDGSGCPTDSDNDGVPNGVDRCPNTAVGATVDASGCPRDTDSDNIPDGVDKCPDTPAGVLVDSTGCPRDSDGDSIPDGLDRCSDTPKGATVDALGCPGDEDSDGVLDGLDRCPRTPFGATVNSSGCSSTQTPTRAPAPAPAPPPAPARDTAAPPQRPTPPRIDLGPSPGAGTVLEGVTFESGSARLQPGSYVELDSIAKVLLSNRRLRVEIGGHTDNSGTAADNLRLSTLRAEAVRNYLVAKGVPFQQMVARGYGATIPRTPDNSPRGRALNRRVEIRPLPPEQ